MNHRVRLVWGVMIVGVVWWGVGGHDRVIAGGLSGASASLPTLLSGLPGVSVGEGRKVVEIPLQPCRGWWLMRVSPMPVSQLRVRVRLPLDLPGPVHFHVLALPERDAMTFVGDSDWPRGALWGIDPASGESVLTLLPPGEVMQTVGAGGMPWRVAPAVLETPPASPPEAVWGASSEYTLKWSEVESRFSYHGGAHLPVMGMESGERTPWVDLTPLIESPLPPGTSSMLIAFAPYAQDSLGGYDLALMSYSLAGASAPPSHPRVEGDYPNDPIMLWESFHESNAPFTVPGPTQTELMKATAFSREAARFPAAWVNSAMQFSLWSATPPPLQVVDVGLRRPGGWQADRLVVWNRTAASVTKAAMKFPMQMQLAYMKSFPIGVAMASEPDSAPALTLAATVNVTFQHWFSVHSDQHLDLDPAAAAQWMGKLEFMYPGISLVFDKWFNAVLVWLAGGMDMSSVSLATLIEIIGIEYFGVHLVPPPVFDDASPYAASTDFINWILELAFTNPPGWSAVDTKAIFLAGEAESKMTKPGITPPPPVAWAWLAPPVYGQLAALASAEPMNLMWNWWKSMVTGVQAAGGFDPVSHPWPGWFPVGMDASTLDASSWMSAYHDLPWAKPMVPPRVPDLSYPGQWRFSGDPNLNWSTRLTVEDYWPPQPPATRETTDGEQHAALVIPTAAYMLGPIEVWIKP